MIFARDKKRDKTCFTSSGCLLIVLREIEERNKQTRDQFRVMSQVDKKSVRQKYQRHESDTGSSDVQIALLTSRIEALTEHLKTHKKDKSSRYGLIKMVSARRRLLNYLKQNDEARYQTLIKELKIRR